MSNGVFPSLNGTTPISTLSFLGCATSTPITDMVKINFYIKIFIHIQNIFNETEPQKNANNNNNINVGISGGSTTKLRDMFAANPEEFESPITGGGDAFFNTPAMLGYNAKNESR